MEGYIVIACIVLIAIVGAVTGRPGGPDPEVVEEAPQSLAENGCGLLVVMLLAIIMIGAVLAF